MINRCKIRHTLQIIFLIIQWDVLRSKRIEYSLKTFSYPGTNHRKLPFQRETLAFNFVISYSAELSAHKKYFFFISLALLRSFHLSRTESKVLAVITHFTIVGSTNKD